MFYFSVSLSCEDADNNLVVPITYTKGGDTLNNRIPPSISQDIATGFMQFRATTFTGTQYAFCPAVK